MHQAAVRVLRAYPERASQVLEVLDRWTVMPSQSPTVLERWRRILDDRNWAALLDDSEQGDDLRRGSPFVFVLGAEERLSIMRHYSRR